MTRLGTGYIFQQHGIAGPHDSSWNWLYIPDMSGVPLGNYGPAPRPRTLNLPVSVSSHNTISGTTVNCTYPAAQAPYLTYYSFAFNGACDNPSSANPVADVSIRHFPLYLPLPCVFNTVMIFPVHVV